MKGKDDTATLRLNDHSNRIKQTEINMTELRIDIRYTKEKVDEIERKLDNFIECAEKKYDEKYASKLVEKVVYTLVGMIMLAVFYALFNLVII